MKKLVFQFNEETEVSDDFRAGFSRFNPIQGWDWKGVSGIGLGTRK